MSSKHHIAELREMAENSDFDRGSRGYFAELADEMEAEEADSAVAASVAIGRTLEWVMGQRDRARQRVTLLEKQNAVLRAEVGKLMKRGHRVRRETNRWMTLHQSKIAKLKSNLAGEKVYVDGLKERTAHLEAVLTHVDGNVIPDLREERGMAEARIGDLVAQVRYLLDRHNDWSEDGYFVFPDGDHYCKLDPR